MLVIAGGLSYSEMSSQLSDGFTCFMGTNPRDPSDNGCSDSAALLMTYIIINFVYNIMMLAITKKGSAVLLVTSQALSLPITNIAFTLKPLMGNNAEPLSITDLAGLVLVCIGFVAYSGFGFAQNFMVAQGPPGQMAYAHFEDHDEIVVTTKVAVEPSKLADFVVGGIIREHMLYQEHLSLAEADNNALEGWAGNDGIPLLPSGDSLRRRHIQEITPLEAYTTALKILRRTTELVEQKERLLRDGDLSGSHLTSPAILSRLNKIAAKKSGGAEKDYGSSSGKHM